MSRPKDIRPGGMNLVAPGDRNPFQDEKAMDWARWLRGNLYDRSLRVVRTSRSARAVREAYRDLLIAQHELAVLGDVRSVGVGHA